MAILTVSEIQGETLKKVSREIASAARGVSEEVLSLLPGGIDDHAGELHSAGADTVIKVAPFDYSPEGMADVVSQVAAGRGAKIILVPHSPRGKDFAGRLAAKIGGTVVADVTSIQGNEESLELTKPVYAGKAYAKVKVQPPVVVTVRPNAMEIGSHKGPETIESSDAAPSGNTTVLTDQTGGSDTKVPLTEAPIVVSGGRGIKGPENWPIIEELTELLGAALGASRAVVDEGWISHEHQVGQTGKTVSPNLYIAIGISGAIQHLAGMSSSRYIAAINTDPEAPIFKVATYGVVEDLFEAVPALTSELKKVIE